MLVYTNSAVVSGIEAQQVFIEVNAGGTVAVGKQLYHVVGLPDKAVMEGFQRIESAIKNIGFRMPRLKLIVNLAPANIRKEGSSYDLPIALGVLAATNQIEKQALKDFLIIGELALDGKLRTIKGVLPIAVEAKRLALKGLIVPKKNAQEAAIVEGLNVFGVEKLEEAIEVVTTGGDDYLTQYDLEEAFYHKVNNYNVDFSDVKGQENIKRALTIAAAGNHNAILIGPPGAGKTMLARRLPTILPKLSLEESLETTKIHSVSGLLSGDTSLVTTRPFRSPHHTISDVALVGGGSQPNPGEISLAHNGVLFLDELPEFKRSVLEVLRQPMENRKVTISRARVCVEYPASFMLIASMNPCPCGFFNHPDKECVCGPGIVKKYLNKISGPLLDRIDLHVEVTPVSYEELSHYKPSDIGSAQIIDQVYAAKNLQLNRFSKIDGIHSNAQMSGRMVRELCNISNESKSLLKTAMKKLQLSARAYDRILKVSRTIADLEGSDNIETSHLAEAIQFRSLDRDHWS